MLLCIRPWLHISRFKIQSKYLKRSFCVAQVFADVTGVDVDVIKNLHTILAVIHCGRQVDWEKFHDFAVSTYRDVVKKYPWYYLPASVHSMLLHGAPIMSVLALPPAYYDEGTP